MDIDGYRVIWRECRGIQRNMERYRGIQRNIMRASNKTALGGKL